MFKVRLCFPFVFINFFPLFFFSFLPLQHQQRCHKRDTNFTVMRKFHNKDCAVLLYSMCFGRSNIKRDCIIFSCITDGTRWNFIYECACVLTFISQEIPFLCYVFTFLKWFYDSKAIEGFLHAFKIVDHSKKVFVNHSSLSNKSAFSDLMDVGVKKIH